MKKISLIALVLAVFVANVRAINSVSTNAAPAAAVVTNPPPPLWDNSLAFGLTLTRGNSDTVLADSTLKAHRDDLTNEVLLSLEGTYGEDHSVKNNESLEAIAQYNHLFTSRFYGYGHFDGLHDGVADVTYRFTISPGVGYYFVKRKATTLGLEIGPGGVIEKLDGERKNYFVGRIAQNFDHKWNAHAHFWEKVEFLPQFDQGNNFLVNAEMGVETTLTRTISLRTVLQDNYNNIPAPGRERNDMKLVTSLVYKF